MYAVIADHLAWMFRPSRFIFGRCLLKHYRVKGWETLYFVDQPKEVEAVNAATGTVFLGGAGNEFLSALLGDQSVFLLDHERHKLARRIMAPGLTAKAVQSHSQMIDRVIDDELAGLPKSGQFSAGPWSRRVAMRVVCKVALGVDNPQQVNRLLSRFEATTGYLANIVSYVKRFWQPKGVISVGTLTALLVRRIDKEIYPLIKSAKANPPATSESVLDLLVKAQPEHGYDDAFIRDNLVALLAAGYDTTGAALSWLFFWLARDHSIREKMYLAWNQGDENALQAFRDEVLRYCPPIEILPRRISDEHWQQARELIDDLATVPASGPDGPMVCPFIHRIHHNNQIWEKPEVFDPDRFNQALNQTRRMGKNEFLPFGAGPRVCAGLNLGRLVLDRVLVGVLSNGLCLQTSQTEFNPVRRNVSIWPGFNLKIKVGKA